MALLQIIIGLTLAGQVQQLDAGEASNGSPAAPESAATHTPGLQPRYGYKLSPVDEESQSQIQHGQSVYENALNGMFGQPQNQTTKNRYVNEIGQTIGCPYYGYAQYLTSCRVDKRKSAWKRIVRESSLFFDRKSIKQFEAISRKYSFL